MKGVLGRYILFYTIVSIQLILFHASTLLYLLCFIDKFFLSFLTKSAQYANVMWNSMGFVASSNVSITKG